MKIYTNSIRFQLILIFGMLSIIICSMILTLTYNQEQNIRTFSKMSEESLTLSQLPVKISAIDHLLDSYLTIDKKDFLDKYELYYSEISDFMASFTPSPDAENLLFYTRTMKGMLEELDVQITDVYRYEGSFDSRTYDRSKYINALLQTMENHSKSLSLVFLQYSSSEYSRTLESIRKKNFTVIGIVLAIFILSLFISVLLTRSIVKTIHKLAVASESISLNQEIPNIRMTHYHELDKVISAFNTMKQSVVENLEKERLIREARLRNLRNQINPHFLFNTLNMISRHALLDKPEQVIQLIASISKILRFNLENNDKMILLSEEIRILESYLHIQKTRFEDKIDFRFQNNLKEDVHCLAMIIQPLVENSIIHGFKDLEGVGELSVEINSLEDCVEIKVSDNGCGFDPAEISEQSTGLRNIQRRLTLIYGRDDLFHLSSEEGKGTQIVCTLPLEATV